MVLLSIKTIHTITKFNNSYEDLVLSDLEEVIILSIIQSSSFSRNYLPKLQNFYDQYLAPELAYPHVKLGIPRLGKVLENV